MNSVGSNNQSLKYDRFTQSDYNYLGIRKLEKLSSFKELKNVLLLIKIYDFYNSILYKTCAHVKNQIYLLCQRENILYTVITSKLWNSKTTLRIKF